MCDHFFLSEVMYFKPLIFPGTAVQTK